LEPSYRVFWKNGEFTDIPSNMNALEKLFDELEENGSVKLKKFLKDAQVKYEIATKDFMQNPGLSWFELINWRALKNALKLDVFKSVETDVAKRFKSEKARSILNFPVLFLGEMPSRIPSLYTLMNYVDLELGTWYPEGGMHALVKALETIARKEGVEIITGKSAESFEMKDSTISGIKVDGSVLETQQVLASGDYHFIEQNLVPEKFRRYSASYWNKRKLAPSCLIFYVGVSKRIPGLQHHNLFFDEDLTAHGKQIYENPSWPDKPLFYVSATSVTDISTAPEGCENLFFLMPIATDIEDTEKIREDYFNQMLQRLEKYTGQRISDAIVYKRSFAINDFKSDYNAYKGNAYGLANTLGQTANLKPKIKSKIKNLHFCGQLTVPGPGIPPALISGKIAAKQILKDYEKNI
ncbi:MAG: phytoene desaturase, partial [Crocinitomicaceae bacterium]|nr:phytoene desaturase [Crocinitomicaceae bacterium]